MAETLVQMPMARHHYRTWWSLFILFILKVYWLTTRGFPLSFRILTALFFGLLQVKIPANPSAIVLRARQRKGVRRYNIIERYMLLLAKNPEIRPLSNEIVFEYVEKRIIN